MSPSRTCVVLAFAFGCLSAGCVGSIHKDQATGGGSSSATPSTPGAPDDTGNTPGGNSAPVTAGSCTLTALPHARVWRLTHTQYRNTLGDIFGYAGAALDALPADARIDGFANRADGLGVSPVLMDHYFQVSDEVAAQVSQHAADFLKCPVAQLGQGTCLTDFLNDVGRRAWRRALGADDVSALTAVYNTAATADGAESGLRSVIEALLVSPNFLFRTELGGGGTPGTTTRLTDDELASALSYALWDAPPDATLMDLASAGKLHEPATLAAQVDRLFTSPKRPRDALNTFLQQWLKIDDLATQEKDATLFPTYSPEVGAALLDEIRLAFESVVFEPGGDRSLRTLFTSSIGFVDAKTASIYGVTGPSATGATLARTDLDHGQRRGILTSGAFLAAHANSDATKVVDRGSFFREEILCADVPPPPGNFVFQDSVVTDDMTAREKLEAHTKNPACASCHILFDGIGYALENYDAIGRFRTMDRTKVIDPSGTMPLPASGTTISFKSFVDLMDQASAKPDVYDCFARQYASYVSGRLGASLDRCESDTLAKAFADSGYRLDALVRAVVTSPSFITRQN